MELTDIEALSLYLLLNREIEHLSKFPKQIDPKNRRETIKRYKGIIDKIVKSYPKIAALKSLDFY